MFDTKSILKNATPVFLASLLLAGCGGGGGGGEGGSAPSLEERAVITEQNAPQVASATTGIIGSSYSEQNGLNTMLRSVSSENISATMIIKNTADKAREIVSKDQPTLSSRSVQTRESGTEQCSNGGSFSYNGNEETGGTVTFNHCKENDMTLNGTATIQLASNGDITTILSNFSMSSTYISADIPSATVKLTNDMTGYSDYNHLSMNMTATTTVSSGEFSGHYAYKNFTIDMTGLSSGDFTTTVNGWAENDCTAGWIKLTTKTPIVASNIYECPYSGDLLVEGRESSLEMVANSDQSIDLLVNGKPVKHYDSCNDLPSTSCGGTT